MRRVAALLAAFLALAVAQAARGEEGLRPGSPPLPGLRVQQPPTTHFLTIPLEPVGPPPGGPAGSVARGRLAPSLDLAYSSLFQVEVADAGTTRYLADLELLSVTPRLAWRPTDRLDLTVALPILVPGSGFLDRSIQDFHDLTSTPNGGREQFPSDRFLSRLVVDGRLVYEGESRPGVGDAALLSSWRLTGGGDRPLALSLRTGIELPTGDASRGFGSGEVDVAAALAASVRGRHGALHAQVDWSLPGDLAGASRVKTHAAYGFGLALEVPLLRDRLVALGQIDGRTPFVSGTGLRVLDDPLLQVSLGGAVRVGGVWLTLAVAEDAMTGTAPDVTFLVRLSPSFH